TSSVFVASTAMKPSAITVPSSSAICSRSPGVGTFLVVRRTSFHGTGPILSSTPKISVGTGTTTFSTEAAGRFDRLIWAGGPAGGGSATANVVAATKAVQRAFFIVANIQMKRTG